MVSWAPDPARPLDGRVHADGTDTEHAAARANRQPRGQQRRAVLERFRELGERGATDFELSRELGFVGRGHVAGTRREELIRDGWKIVDSGERRPTDTGRQAIVWKLASLEEPQSGVFGETLIAHGGAGRGSSSDEGSQLALLPPGSVYRKDVAG